MNISAMTTCHWQVSDDYFLILPPWVSWSLQILQCVYQTSTVSISAPLSGRKLRRLPWHIFVVLYDECANLGLQLPVLTYPGQNLNRTLSSVAPPSSQTTVATTIIFIPPPFFPTTAASSTTGATSTQAPASKLSSSFGIRSAETSCFNLIFSAILLPVGLWFNFAVQWELWVGGYLDSWLRVLWIDGPLLELW